MFLQIFFVQIGVAAEVGEHITQQGLLEHMAKRALGVIRGEINESSTHHEKSCVLEHNL